MTDPGPWRFDPVQGEYRVAGERPARGPGEISAIDLFRSRSMLLLGATGFVGKVIVVGATNKRVPSILGWDMAATMEEAIEMAESHVGRKPSITLMHFPPILMADVAGVPESIPRHDLESVGAPAS